MSRLNINRVSPLAKQANKVVAMAEVAPAAAAAAAPAKTSAKKKASSGNKAPGPSASELILQAVAESKDRNGVSLAALKKYLAGKGYDVEKNRSRLKSVIKGMVVKGAIVQTKGTGASGSFKMSKKTEVKKPKALAKADGKTSAKDKKASIQKGTASKRPAAAAKKAAKKSGKPTTPKKAKKPAKVAKKTPPPKKASSAKKSPAAKKASAAKKVAKPRTVKRAPPKKK
ncbi:histone H1-like [Syngnathoides biaculeatus]|uniref:histone H1-like n=1 Tax=Syngnathoides biaculeatus TaxID=300417 RepID=UPI002ADE287D|nr:histone H1-like [Syngnathoides biaculeatus]